MRTFSNQRALGWQVLFGAKNKKTRNRTEIREMSATYTYWQDPNGWYVGYWNDYPDHSTQGHTHEELKHMLLSLRADIREMIAEGVMPDDHKNVGELAFA